MAFPVSESMDMAYVYLNHALEDIAKLGFNYGDRVDVRSGLRLQLNGFFNQLGYLNQQGAYDSINLKQETKIVLDKIFPSYPS